MAKKEKKTSLTEISVEDLPEIKFTPAPALKKFENKQQINVRYALIEPFVSVHIYWNQQIGELVYEIEEPLLTKEEYEVMKRLESSITELLNVNMLKDKEEKAIVEYLHKTAKLLVSELGLKINLETYRRIFYYLWRDFIGMNEIEPLLKDFFIEDIECNGFNSPVYIVHRVYRNLRTNLVYKDVKYLASFVEKLAQRAGRYISYATPILDGTLPDGSRVNATYSTDVTSKGPTFTIRKFTRVPWTPPQLLAFNTLSPEMLAYFWLLIQYKSNILITGGTGSGKTTFLNAIAFFIPPEARVVSIEDTRELSLPRENWLPSVSRTGVGTAGAGEVDLFSLLRASFRQNPDYVIVGEVRGKEASVLFQGMASGHPSLSTFHADSVDTVINRLQTPPINLSPTLINILDAVVVATHATVKNQETRKIREVVEILNFTPQGGVTVNIPFKWNPQNDVFYFKMQSRVFEKIMQRYGLSQQKLISEFQARTRIMQELAKRKIFDFNIVQRIVNDYYKNPQLVLQKLGIIK
ncbi:secretion system protein E [Candidatus Pacearchaeota archaeon CG_4_9_14_3_um_filter_31_7]|nr:MAG: secretion system protein E [Candidatus Pacearchaeota archaeon CG10_big_fil_rev_8_21_14_0_10_31_59]PIZ80126.1 MAG: secretion system protein E [Candidatus Pacearchaeota archaeon CG_4_10_14_0_2_um_filter_31_10]PJA70894.1 MAG: secretion system protein E [Candidatus Pacearchaeota archaeon CG_4_9_14_3_um_filter_31_7]